MQLLGCFGSNVSFVFSLRGRRGTEKGRGDWGEKKRIPFSFSRFSSPSIPSPFLGLSSRLFVWRHLCRCRLKNPRSDFWYRMRIDRVQCPASRRTCCGVVCGFLRPHPRESLDFGIHIFSNESAFISPETSETASHRNRLRFCPPKSGQTNLQFQRKTRFLCGQGRSRGGLHPSTKREHARSVTAFQYTGFPCLSF